MNATQSHTNTLDDLVATPAYAAPMDFPVEGIAVIQEPILIEMLERVKHKNHSLALTHLGNGHFAIDLVVRGINSSLHTVTTLVHCTGIEARKDANIYLHIIRDKIEEIKRKA